MRYCDVSEVADKGAQPGPHLNLTMGDLIEMRRKLRPTLLFTAALFMGFAAFVNAIIVIPHLREDMVEINVRPTLLGAVSLALHFGTVAMFAFTLLVLAAAMKSLKGAGSSRMPLWIIGATYTVFGTLAFILSGSHHALGYLVVGLLVLAAAVIRE
ncbi:MAG TPA: hypothetical protein VK475_11400 [Pyrinomonadaceae bacterium]|nr:hypothetical protein [Pyrinomonadaceae bacterium]